MEEPAKLTAEEIKSAKKLGFLRNRGTNLFSGRIVAPGGVYSPDQLQLIANCAKQFGSGKVAFTSRLNAEIIGVPYEKITQAMEFMEQSDDKLLFGGTGDKIRPVTACKGTTCVFGRCDTQKFAKELHEAFYLGWSNTPLPHKFKICVGGCSNSCMRPSLNDFGLEACGKQNENKFKVYLGGVGLTPGIQLENPIQAHEIIPMIEKVLNWYIENGKPKERLAKTIQRVGMESLKNFIS